MAGGTSGKYLDTFPRSLGVEDHVVIFFAWCTDHDDFAKAMRSVKYVCACWSCNLTLLVTSSFMLSRMASRWSQSSMARSKWSLEW